MRGPSVVWRCVSALLLAAPAVAGGEVFQPGVPTGFPVGLLYAVAADITHDGVVDAVSVAGNGVLYVAPGTGDGHFTAPTLYVAGASPVSATTGDVNSDGLVDVVVPNWGGHSVSVLLGAANGTLTSQPQVQTGSNPRLALLIDLNEDGKLDIAVSNEAIVGAVTVLLGSGTGSFPTRIDVATGDQPYGISAADFDHDGHLDLATADGGLSKVTVLYGDGTGHFPRRWDSGFIPGRLFGIGAGDLNGDGWADLVLSCSRTQSALAVLLGQTDGTFTAWSATYDFPAPTGVGQIVVATIDGDAIPDVLVTGEYASMLTLYHGSSSTALAGREDFVTPSGPVSVSVARLNADSPTDAIVARTDPDDGSGGAVAFLAMPVTAVHDDGHEPGNPIVAYRDGRLRIRFSLTAPARVTATIFNVAGQRAADILDAQMTGGEHDMWYEIGYSPARGIYLVRMLVGEERVDRRLVVF